MTTWPPGVEIVGMAFEPDGGIHQPLRLLSTRAWTPIRGRIPSPETLRAVQFDTVLACPLCRASREAWRDQVAEAARLKREDGRS